MRAAAAKRERPEAAFRYRRILRPADVPPASERAVDVAFLDMNHDWPNLGHDCLVRAVQEIAHDLEPLLEEAGLSVRVLSYEIRSRGMVPERSRHRIHVGTGGPGHIDPHKNDGRSRASQGIAEDPAWEAPLFRLYDSIVEDPDAALLAVCHTFGTICRWSGIARPVLRGKAKGGKSSGVKENLLTPAGRRHPWFRRLARRLPGGERLLVVDNRLFDLVPRRGRLPAGASVIGREISARTGEPTRSLTMVELARDAGGVMPRVFAVNHHPEIRDRRRQKRILDQKLARREVSAAWYRERAQILSQAFASPGAEAQVTLTSQYTLLAPLRFYIYREVRLRSEALGHPCDLHEDRVLDLPSGILDRED